MTKEQDDKKTLVDPPATRRLVTEPIPTRRSGLPPTIEMTAAMPARPPSTPPTTPMATTPSWPSLSYDVYSVGHLPPLRPPPPPRRRTGRAVALAILGLVIAGSTIAAVALSLEEDPPTSTTTITSAPVAAPAPTPRPSGKPAR